MRNESAILEQIIVPRIADIPELNWRGFRGEEDFPKMVAIIHGCTAADGTEPSETVEDIANHYAHLHHCDPFTDMQLAEVGGEVVGYCRGWWEVEGSGKWVGFQTGYVLPSWRHRGIGSRLLWFSEERLSQIARQLKKSQQLPLDAPCELDNFVKSSETDKINLLERRGYQAVRYEYIMVRPDLENIPDLPLPPGVEVRPVKAEQMRLIWEASNEAFRDHWGYIPDPWEEYEQIMNSPDFDPSLYQVAWQGDQIAGMVLCFINKDENEMYGRERGYTENICVRRPWRKKGLARALIAQSLITLKKRGMAEAGLGVDSENTSGAFKLYQFMGYQVVNRMTVYRKPIYV